MASMNASLSVSTKRGGSPVVSHKIVKCEWTDTLRAIVSEGGSEFESQEISNSNCFFLYRPTDPELLSGMPVKQLLQLKWPRRLSRS